MAQRQGFHLTGDKELHQLFKKTPPHIFNKAVVPATRKVMAPVAKATKKNITAAHFRGSGLLRKSKINPHNLFLASLFKAVMAFSTFFFVFSCRSHNLMWIIVFLFNFFNYPVLIFIKLIKFTNKHHFLSPVRINNFFY